jgi:hypothetical protein
MDPELDEPEEPDEPIDPDDPDEPELPGDPAEEPDDPEPVPPLLDCAPAGSAMSRLAIPSPVTIPLPIFIRFPSTVPLEDGPGTQPWRVVLAFIR